jgi:predicted Zn finger-like uncharacterized protein
MSIVVKCPKCGAQYRVQDSALGKVVACKTPQCGGRIVVAAPTSEVEEVVFENDAGDAGETWEAQESPVARPKRKPAALHSEALRPAVAAPSGTSSLAIVSLVCGLASFIFSYLAGLVAIITGIIALVKINQSGGRVGGKGMAIAGISLGLVAPALILVLLLPGVGRVREAAQRTGTMNNLKQIGLALYNYHDSMMVFPPGGVFTAEGEARHGWQTMLLPYVEQGFVYNKVNFNVPWTNAENRPQFQTKIPAYLSPGNTEEVDANGYALSHYAGNSFLFGKNTSLRLSSITDGTANTIMAGEANGNFKAWGHPENWRDPSDGIARGPDSFGRLGSTGASILFCDGSVRFLDAKTDPKILQAMATPSGGEVINIPDH